jgi:hypothetical protein
VALKVIEAVKAVEAEDIPEEIDREDDFDSESDDDLTKASNQEILLPEQQAAEEVKEIINDDVAIYSEDSSDTD